MVDKPLTVTPIGVLRSPFDDKADAPRQPRAAEGVEGAIELYPGRGYDDALSDIAGWEYLWVLFWFDQSDGWKPKVLPPRSEKKRGVFATRSPRRPNPLGLSVVRLRSVDGLTLAISDVDVLDGTPVLDIKPYVAWTDAIPGAKSGWLAPFEDQPTAPHGVVRPELPARPEDPGPSFEVRYTFDAEAQLAFLAERGVELRPRIDKALALGPQPHAYRRIKVFGDRRRLALKDWRVWFRAEGTVLTVEGLESGYKPKALRTVQDAALDPHRDFVAEF